MLASLTKYAVALSAYGAGLLANWYFLRFAAMQNMAARWVVAFALGYAVFIGAVRLYCGARTTMRVRLRRSKSGEPGLSDVAAIRTLDEGAALLVAMVVALALSAVGLGATVVYLLFRMPALLSDAAAGMAAGLASGRTEGWLGAVLRHTWKPALIGVASLLAVAIALHVAFPTAHTIGDAWTLVHGAGHA